MRGGGGVADVRERQVQQHPDVRVGQPVVRHPARPADLHHPVRTQQSQFMVDGAARPVRSGMTVQADIVTDRRRVIDFFLSPVVKYLDEGLKVR